jgi:chemotaxis receptor (MCP) glutamine deamidase CheD
MYKSKNILIFATFIASSAIAMQKNIPHQAIAEVLQSEMAFTDAKDPKYALATSYCGPCVAVGGYDETNQSAFIAHFSTGEEVKSNMEMLLNNIAQLAKKPLKKPIQLHLRGGRVGVNSEETIAAIKELMTQRSNLPMQIASQDVMGNEAKIRSLLLNAKTGQVGGYYPILNPGYRKDDLGLLTIIMSGLGVLKMRVAYQPAQISSASQQSSNNLTQTNGPKIEEVD